MVEAGARGGRPVRRRRSGAAQRAGDRHGTPFKDGAVTTAPGWTEAYRAWAQAGWNGLAAPAQWGGQALPHAINAACIEMWNSAAMAFGLGPLLTMAAVEALVAHGSDELKRAYLPKLVSGEWMGTMQLTEPQAGSDVGALRTRAERAGDGSYRITGQKIFITYGEHDLTDNIVHFVLARLPDAPPGNQGHLAVPGAEIPAQPRRLARRAQRRARAIRSSTSSASTPRPPAPWSTATTAAPPAT